jgi:hypothetical protein
MLRQLIIAIAAASSLGISFYPTDALARRTRAAVADGVPNWDLTASCRAAGTVSGYAQTPDERMKSCLASEQRTREELSKNWSTFPGSRSRRLREVANFLAHVYRACDLP